jgi:hypothetical protein
VTRTEQGGISTASCCAKDDPIGPTKGLLPEGDGTMAPLSVSFSYEVRDGEKNPSEEVVEESIFPNALDRAVTGRWLSLSLLLRTEKPGSVVRVWLGWCMLSMGFVCRGQPCLTCR